MLARFSGYINVSSAPSKPLWGVRESARDVGVVRVREVCVRAVRESPLPFLAGALYVFLCGFGVVVAKDAAGQRVLYLVVTACIPVDDHRIVTVSDLFYGVIRRALLFAQLASWVVYKEDILFVNAISMSALQLVSSLFRLLE
jgi:hypothetical protein